MRTDKNGNMKTLEQDIIETWKRHGLEVLQEEVSVGENKIATWMIKAKTNHKINEIKRKDA